MGAVHRRRAATYVPAPRNAQTLLCTALRHGGLPVWASTMSKAPAQPTRAGSARDAPLLEVQRGWALKGPASAPHSFAQHCTRIAWQMQEKRIVVAPPREFFAMHRFASVLLAGFVALQDSPRRHRTMPGTLTASLTMTRASHAATSPGLAQHRLGLDRPGFFSLKGGLKPPSASRCLSGCALSFPASLPGTFAIILETELRTEVPPLGRQLVLAFLLTCLLQFCSTALLQCCTHVRLSSVLCIASFFSSRVLRLNLA